MCRVLLIFLSGGRLVSRSDFMRRNWLKSPLLRSQALAETPEQYDLRPHLYQGKFPKTRTIRIPDYLERCIQQQEKDGHLMFDGDSEQDLSLPEEQKAVMLRSETDFQLMANK